MQLRIFRFSVYKCKNQNAQTTILLVVVYRCKTWSLTFKKDLVNEFENRLMKGIFGRNGETVTTVLEIYKMKSFTFRTIPQTKSLQQSSSKQGGVHKCLQRLSGK